MPCINMDHKLVDFCDYDITYYSLCHILVLWGTLMLSNFLLFLNLTFLRAIFSRLLCHRRYIHIYKCMIMYICRIFHICCLDFQKKNQAVLPTWESRVALEQINLGTIINFMIPRLLRLYTWINVNKQPHKPAGQ